jgi:hypothetical protein
MNVTAIMATCGRHFCCERSLSLFLNQCYEKKHLLIYQNSEVAQSINPCIDLKLVTLVNNCIDSETNEPYKNLGAIYRDAIKYIPAETDLITFWDDDDIFVRDHIDQGVNGIRRGGKIAYKPKFSYHYDGYSITRQRNNFEPSIFVKLRHVLEYGFSDSTIDQHLKWLNPLIRMDQLYIDENGKSTLVYNWGDRFYTYKTSQRTTEPDCFQTYRQKSTQHGDRLISPMDISTMMEKIENLIAKAD